MPNLNLINKKLDEIGCAASTIRGLVNRYQQGYIAGEYVEITAAQKQALFIAAKQIWTQLNQAVNDVRDEFA